MIEEILTRLRVAQDRANGENDIAYRNEDKVYFDGVHEGLQKAIFIVESVAQEGK